MWDAVSNLAAPSFCPVRQTTMVMVNRYV